MNIVFTVEEDKQIAVLAERLGISDHAVKVRLKNVYEANFVDDLDWVAEMFDEDSMLEQI